MAEYSAAIKARLVQRLVGPQAVSATALAHEVGVSQESLSRWLRAARSVGEMPPSNKQQQRPPKPQWTGAEKLRVLTEAAGLTGSDLGAFLRREGAAARMPVPERRRYPAPGSVVRYTGGCEPRAQMAIPPSPLLSARRT